MGLWQSLLLTGTGAIIASAATWLGTRLQFKEAGRIRREQYEREDLYRLHQARVVAYCDLYSAAGKVRATLAWDAAPPESRRQARNAYWREAARVSLLGHEDVRNSAKAILAYVDAVIDGTTKFDPVTFGKVIQHLETAARTDLTGSISPTESSSAVDEFAESSDKAGI
jgi:hypothetical protein